MAKAKAREVDLGHLILPFEDPPEDAKRELTLTQLLAGLMEMPDRWAKIKTNVTEEQARALCQRLADGKAIPGKIPRHFENVRDTKFDAMYAKDPARQDEWELNEDHWAVWARYLPYLNDSES